MTRGSRGFHALLPGRRSQLRQACETRANVRTLGHDCLLRKTQTEACPTRGASSKRGYILAGVAAGILLFRGTGSLPSAAAVRAMNWGSSRSEAKTASTRASIISLERTA